MKKKRFAPITFRLDLSRSQLVALVGSYLSDQKEVAREMAAFAAGVRIAHGEHTHDVLDPIIRWKSERPKSLLAGNTDEEVCDSLRLATSATTDRAAVAVLCGLRGVLVPVASAIFTATFPERFTVIDFRALETLGVKLEPPTVEHYLQYLDFCRGKAREMALSLRDLDRALWKHSKSGLNT